MDVYHDAGEARGGIDGIRISLIVCLKNMYPILYYYVGVAIRVRPFVSHKAKDKSYVVGTSNLYCW